MCLIKVCGFSFVWVCVELLKMDMSRRIHRKVARRENDSVVMPSCPEFENEGLSLNEEGIVDWVKLPYDTVIQLLSSLNYRDRASLSSTCRTWWGFRDLSLFVAIFGSACSKM